MQTHPHDHISVCICTYKRPPLLRQLLRELQHQVTDDLFTYSIVVVDNDFEQSARDTTESFKGRSLIEMEYLNEPRQNIALARNKAVENAQGDLIAFIDDDEFPEPAWLLNLYKALVRSGAAGVLGPVKPHFEIEPPKWIVKAKLFERKAFETGTTLQNVRDMRTGNVLLSGTLLDEKTNLFDPQFGRTGGEDSDFFKRMLQKGSIFIWCNEASVYERISPQRLKRSYLLRRALLRGVVRSRRDSFNVKGTLKSLIAFPVYTMALPVLFVTGHHLFMKYLIKDCDHIGKLLALCGLEVVKERTF
jgi:succinoglycan biosynthesis protein ExoM